MTHTVIPTCLLTDYDDRIELSFGRPIDSYDIGRVELLIRDRFPWCTSIEWRGGGGRATIRKPDEEPNQCDHEDYEETDSPFDYKTYRCLDCGHQW